MKKLTLTVSEFLLFRKVCELYRIAFEYWSKPGGTYEVQANAQALEQIGY